MARARYSKGKVKVNLQLTSILDIMTMVLVFLLKLFSAEGQLLTQADNLVLPVSTSKTAPKEVMLTMEVNQDWVMVDHVPTMRTEEVRKMEESTLWPVKERLEKAMAQEEKLVKIGAAQSVKGEVVMQIDKNVEYDVVFKVMTTCGEVGYNKVRFATISALEE